jgi:phosphatidylglycerol:prolipoprotein diacylglycerol transferase
MLNLFRSLFAPPRHFILLLAALWIGLALAEKRSERHGVSKDALNNLTMYGLVGFVLGGRILYAVANLSAFAESPLNLFSINVDLFDPVGGMIVAVVVGIVYGKRQNLPVWGTLDALTPVFALLAIGLHLSHLAAGTAFGCPTDLPWGIELWNATRHPTQIYELIAAMVIFGFLWFRKPSSAPGVLFLDFVALSAGARLFLEAFRGDSAFVFGEYRLAQLFAWIVLALVLVLKDPRANLHEL